jgi:hypothetical protein
MGVSEVAVREDSDNQGTLITPLKRSNCLMEVAG